MISQSDIIKILVQRKCSDESVMSTANSPNCSLTQLIEKLIEAERFDLALDISMKLGLDVTPICKTWAMRCLSARNFTMAREKFRYCFKRLCPQGNRTSIIQTKLVADILDELRKLEEKPMLLVEKVELIKNGNYISNASIGASNPPVIAMNEYSSSIMASKTSILAECRYYLQEYGNICDLIKFNLQNHLWPELIMSLMDNWDKNSKMDQLFLSEVIPYVNSTGNLGTLLGVIQKCDPKFDKFAIYIKSLYGFCARNRRYHSLYYIQRTIGDLLAAANTQLRYFFLIKPVKNYRELGLRRGSLTKALNDHQNFIQINYHGITGMSRGKLASFFTDMSEIDIKSRIVAIQRQIKITENFAFNEVSGCLSQSEELSLMNIDNDNDNDENNDDPGLQVGGGPDYMSGQYDSSRSPVTLFDQSKRRKSYLAALVLIYYDQTCKSYFSRDGLQLANEIIWEYSLDKLSVFKIAMRILLEEEGGCDIMRNVTLLLECLKSDIINSVRRAKEERARKRKFDSSSNNNCNVYSVNDANVNIDEMCSSICDQVLRDSIANCREQDYKMELSKLLSNEAKIELYIEIGKLSNAQMLACNLNRPDYVSNIIEKANELNQNHVKTVCQLWLAKRETTTTKTN